MVRYLRIAWSAVWVIATIVILAVWVHSYSRQYWLSSPDYEFSVTSELGRLNIQGDLSSIGATVEGNHWTLDDDQAGRNGPPFDDALGFAFVNLSIDRLFIMIPYWCPAFLCATAAAAPWVRLSRRYRLRTLLIGTAVIAVLLGLQMYESNRVFHYDPNW